MGIKHKSVVVSGQRGLATEWNDDHEIDTDVDWEDNKIINLADPTLDQDAATKKSSEDYTDAFFDTATGHDHDDVNSKALNLGVFNPVIERYYSIAPPDWIMPYPATDAILIFQGGAQAGAGANLRPLAPIHLPNGAIITKAVVWGSVSNKNWRLRRITIASGANVSLVARPLNTEFDALNETVDNTTYAYFFHIANDLAIGDTLYGGRITYTIDKVYMS